MHTTRNTIIECYDGKSHFRGISIIDTFVFHRISRAYDASSEFGAVADRDLTGPLVAAWFRDTAPHRPGAYTGGETPYTALIRTDGSMDQMLRAGDQGAHAARFNRRGLGFAFAGDFRDRAPTVAQIDTAVQIASAGLAAGIQVLTHDQTTPYPKGCPGQCWPQQQILYRAREAKGDHKTIREVLDELGLVP